MLRRLNPFRNLENPREVWAWGMYDLANQSFQLLINTLLFSLYIKVIVVADGAAGQKAWSLMAASQLAIVVLLSPFIGAMADQRGWRRELLLGSGVLCAALTGCLAMVGPGQVWLAASIYIVAAVACGLGENFLASFLPRISTEKNIGFVSALGWTMSYVGALLLLGILAAYAFGLNRSSAAQMPPMFVFAGLWFLAGIVPAALFLRDDQPASGRGNIIAGAARRLARSVRETGKFRQLATFFGVFFIYTIGVQAMIFFLGLIGDSMGFGLDRLILFALIMAAASGVGAVVTARVQDRVGHRRTIQAFLLLWLVGTATLAVSRAIGAPSGAFWAASAIIGLGLGGVGTASRALVGLFTPEDRAAEFFGVWGMTTKLAAIVGVLAMGMIGIEKGLWVLCGCFVLGFVLMFLVDERAGAAAARGVQSGHGGTH